MNQAIPYTLIASGIGCTFYGVKNLFFVGQEQTPAEKLQQRNKALLLSTIGVIAIAYGVYTLKTLSAQIIAEKRKALLATLLTKASPVPEEVIKNIFDEAILKLGKKNPAALVYQDKIWKAVAPKQIEKLQSYLAQEVNDHILSKFQPDEIGTLLKEQKEVAYSMLSLDPNKKMKFDHLFEYFLPTGDLSEKERKLADTLSKRILSIQVLFREEIIDNLAIKAKELANIIVKDMMAFLRDFKNVRYLGIDR